jgi:spore maturation protein CgeB
MCGSTILHYELEGQPESQNILKPGVNCLTYRPEDSEDLKEKLRFLIDNPEQAMQLSVNALSDVSSNHTIATRLQQMAAIAREFLSLEAPVRPAYLNPR